MIDLHSHTNHSDGSFTPAELVREAKRVGLSYLGITDHDTFSGYDEARPIAETEGLGLVCGIELSVKLNERSVHLLGYFFDQARLGGIREWVTGNQRARRERNENLMKRLQSLGLDITLEEVEALGGRMAGRPHVATLLLKKGYVTTMQEAFDVYLAEGQKGYVQRREPTMQEGLGQIAGAGGVASMAHPIRVKDDLPSVLPELIEQGLSAIEAYHSDHSPELTREYLDLAKRFDLLVTGGSDFHGSYKPGLHLGTGRDGNVRVPDEILDGLRKFNGRAA